MAYNIAMETRENKNRIPVFQRIFFPLCVVATLVFIFCNSLQTGEQSSVTSGGVVEILQEFARKTAPNSFVATATGKAYELLHAIVRMLAHFAEFAMLGAFVAWTYFAYLTDKRFFLVAFTFLLCMPIIDEYIQLTVAGRGAQVLDVLVDTLGSVCGFLFGWITRGIAVAIHNKKAAKRAAKGV